MSDSQISFSSLFFDPVLTQECKDLISSLPKDKSLVGGYVYQYQGFWYPPALLQDVLNLQKQFQSKDNDIILVSSPKSGTTWLKAIVFSLINRNTFRNFQENHPLLTNNPHSLVPFLEGLQYYTQDLPDMSSPRLYSTHIPLVSLPETIKVSSCKIVYCCRNPKDVITSLWHFGNKLTLKEMMGCAIEDMVNEFCRGSSVYGPYWDHVLGYWRAHQENPKKVLFLMYEEMKQQPMLQLKRLADFLDCPFTKEEEAKGTIDDIIRLCSFKTLSNLDVNKNGKLSNGMDSNSFFRKGETGGWRDTLTATMREEIDRMIEEKFCSSGLKFHE